MLQHRKLLVLKSTCLYIDPTTFPISPQEWPFWLLATPIPASSPVLPSCLYLRKDVVLVLTVDCLIPDNVSHLFCHGTQHPVEWCIQKHNTQLNIKCLQHGAPWLNSLPLSNPLMMSLTPQCMIFNNLTCKAQLYPRCPRQPHQSQPNLDVTPAHTAPDNMAENWPNAPANNNLIDFISQFHLTTSPEPWQLVDLQMFVWFVGTSS